MGHCMHSLKLTLCIDVPIGKTVLHLTMLKSQNWQYYVRLTSSVHGTSVSCLGVACIWEMLRIAVSAVMSTYWLLWFWWSVADISGPLATALNLRSNCVRTILVAWCCYEVWWLLTRISMLQQQICCWLNVVQHAWVWVSAVRSFCPIDNW